MRAQMTKKKRNPSDLTLRNLRAICKRLTRLEDEVRGLHALSTYLLIQLQALTERKPR